MEKCSDGKRASSAGNLKGKWDARYMVLSKQGVWWFASKEDWDDDSVPAKGCLLELASAEINVGTASQPALPPPSSAPPALGIPLSWAGACLIATCAWSDDVCGCVACVSAAQYDQTFAWLQFITPERTLSIRPEDRYEDLRAWIGERATHRVQIICVQHSRLSP